VKEEKEKSCEEYVNFLPSKAEDFGKLYFEFQKFTDLTCNYIRNKNGVILKFFSILGKSQRRFSLKILVRDEMMTKDKLEVF
jgi:hypothetical protein